MLTRAVLVIEDEAVVIVFPSDALSDLSFCVVAASGRGARAFAPDG
jgi:hypothetical protein